MTDHKFTDDEVIKGLGVLVAYDCKRCLDLGHDCFGKDCDKVIAENALALIKRQKVEIERLTTERDEARRDCAVAEHNHQLAVAEREANVEGFIETLKTIKAEAIKEFAERLKSDLGRIPQYHFTRSEVEWSINALEKEMTEGTK